MKESMFLLILLFILGKKLTILMNRNWMLGNLKSSLISKRSWRISSIYLKKKLKQGEFLGAGFRGLSRGLGIMEISI
ncbi:MAG: hypothetical protein K8R11_06190 [Methanococcoides sp.]|nr:hypothetical protein [Methanococcoides sp.]